MPRFHLQFYQGVLNAPVTRSQELTDEVVAYAEAIVGAKEMVATALLKGSSLKEALRGAVSVADDQGTQIFAISFMHGVKIKLAYTSHHPRAFRPCGGVSDQESLMHAGRVVEANAN